MKSVKNKTVFYSCEKYPDCDFSSWDIPTAEKCPQCGKMLFRKKGKPLLICRAEGCRYERALEDGEAAEGAASEAAEQTVTKASGTAAAGRKSTAKASGRSTAGKSSSKTPAKKTTKSAGGSAGGKR